mgnify:CR=1 FL=1
MDFTAALPTFVITLREGVEAALVVGIVLACLYKAERSHLKIWVWSGIAAGIVASAAIGFLLEWVMTIVRQSESSYATVIEPLLETSLCVIAIAMLSWMLLWMTQQARSLKGEIEGTIAAQLQRESSAVGWGIFTLIFIAVAREGFEAVLFIVAKFQQGWVPLLGAIAGVLGAVTIGVLLFQFGIKINLRSFFQVMGVFLLLIVSGLVVSAFKNLDATVSALASINPNFANICLTNGDSCILGQRLWDLKSTLNDDRFPGILLKSLFGYRDEIFLGQAIAYILFLTSAGLAYFQSISGGGVARKPQENT